jgi:hypothetical protein
VHYDEEPARRAEYHRLVADGMSEGFAVEDGVGLHFRGTELHRVVSSRSDGAAYRVRVRADGRVRETRLAAERLGEAEPPSSPHLPGVSDPATTSAHRVASASARNEHRTRAMIVAV